MEWITVTAPTVSEAKEQLLDKLGVPDGEAEFVVEDEGESKFFGLRKMDARVKARVSPRRTEPRRDRKRKSSDRPQNKRAGGKSGSKGGRSGKASGDASTRVASSGDPTGDAGRDDATSDAYDRSPKADRPGRQRSDKQGRTRPKKEEISMEQVQENLTTFLNGLTTAFGIDSAAELTIEDEHITANVPGQHGVLIGPKARTLDAIQELAKIASFKGGTSPARVRVDVGDYRKKRAAALGEFASKAAERALADETEVVLDPMSSADRKVVHDALSTIEGIQTRSVGTDPRRQVVIAPIDAEV